MVEQRASGTTFSALVLVTLWLGAALFLAAVVAPAAFTVLPTRTLAGALVGRVLPALFIVGVIVGLVQVALEQIGSRNRHWLARSVAALLLSLACGVAQFGIAPRIAHLREVAGVALDTLAATSQARAEFGRLHMLSIAWLGVAILAAASIVLFAWLGFSSATSKAE